jgi:hypothetical protein
VNLKAYQDEMINPSGDYPESRPFKIFISLLDKWEIGAALTDTLAYDALQAARVHVESERGTAEDVRVWVVPLFCRRYH